MLNNELIKRLQGFGKDADRVFAEFPKAGGPYRSPSEIVAGLNGEVIIETVYPRNDLIVRDFFIRLMDCPREADVLLFLNRGGSHPIAYYNIGMVRIRVAGIVLIASDLVTS